nr:hypothetical protein [Desulforamulus aquiferis]
METSLYIRGITQIEVPPLGLVRAHTHRTPVMLTVRLNNIDLDHLRHILEESPDQAQLTQQLELRCDKRLLVM